MAPARIATFVLAVSAGPFVAAPGLAMGEGTGTDNPDLLRGSYAPFCERAMLCHYGTGGPGQLPAPSEPTVSAAPQETAAPPARYRSEVDPVVVEADPILTYSAVPASAVYRPALETELSIGLHGSVIVGHAGTRYEAGLRPRATLEYQGAGARAGIAAQADLIRPDEGDLRIASVGLDGRYGRVLGPNSGLEIDGAMGLSQDDPRGIDGAASGSMTAPLDFDAQANATLANRFGRAEVRLRGGVARELHDIDRAGARSEDDVWRTSLGLRAGYDVTPIATVFVDGSVRRDDFDRPTDGLGVSRSGWNRNLRAGVAANWSDAWTAELSAGYGWRTFDAGTLMDARTVLYGAAIGFSPNPTTDVRLGFDTELAPGSGGAVSSVDYTLSFEADYTVNPWLAVAGRASASWEDRDQGDALARRYEAGAGADIAVGAHTDLNIEYGYVWRSDPGETPAEADEHRVSGGLTLRY